MARTKKICFVIMGFGKKTDFSTGKTLDLDKTYKNIIQPAVESAGFECIRADEIQDSGIIDRSMYALLMHADLVIADISTFNPNAIYELGIRHAVRPFSTIVIKEEDGKIPFDLDHTRIFHYKHLGVDIGADEADRCQKELCERIKRATSDSFIDSPLYSFIQNISPPKLPKAEYQAIITDLADREKHIFAIAEKATELMKNDNFVDAAKLWAKAAAVAPSEDYFVQQQALATYKSKKPSEETALADALSIIDKLKIDGDSNDPETLGITGSIYKRMWSLNGDIECLRRSITNYEKGFQITNDFYTGENYALCLDMMSTQVTDPRESIYYEMSAKKAREKILTILADIETAIRENPEHQYKWASATLANCYFALGNDNKGNEFESIFISLTEAIWEKETYNESKSKIFDIVRKEKK